MTRLVLVTLRASHPAASAMAWARAAAALAVAAVAAVASGWPHTDGASRGPRRRTADPHAGRGLPLEDHMPEEIRSKVGQSFPQPQAPRCLTPCKRPECLHGSYVSIKSDLSKLNSHARAAS